MHSLQLYKEYKLSRPFCCSSSSTETDPDARWPVWVHLDDGQAGAGVHLPIRHAEHALVIDVVLQEARLHAAERALAVLDDVICRTAEN